MESCVRNIFQNCSSQYRIEHILSKTKQMRSSQAMLLLQDPFSTQGDHRKSWSLEVKHFYYGKNALNLHLSTFMITTKGVKTRILGATVLLPFPTFPQNFQKMAKIDHFEEPYFKKRFSVLLWSENKKVLIDKVYPRKKNFPSFLGTKMPFLPLTKYYAYDKNNKENSEH